MSKLWEHDSKRIDGCDWLLGVDEAGRGALAGPVVAAACVLGRGFFESSDTLECCREINDSKQLAAEKRERLFGVIEGLRDAGVLDFETGSASLEEIEERNILGATALAMRRALEGLQDRSEAWNLPGPVDDSPLFQNVSKVRIQIDGKPLKAFPYAHQGLVKGDGKSLSIAIASIAAKVGRDRVMCGLDGTFPGYGFAGHKGYGTVSHRSAILRTGPCAIHRKSFLRKILADEQGRG